MSTITKAISVCLQAKVPVIMEGEPGGGKTQLAVAMGKHLGMEPVKAVVITQYDPAELTGFPRAGEKFVERLAADWIKPLIEAQKGLLFVDEFNLGSMLCQGAILRVLSEREVGHVKLPDEVAMILAVNPTECSAGGSDLSAPAANRLCWLPWKPTVDEWGEGFSDNWAAPPDILKINPNWKLNIPTQRSLIKVFLTKHKRALFWQLPKDNLGKAWPSPRTWTMAASLRAASAGFPDVSATLMEGCIGSGAAHSFLTWERELDLPVLEELFAKPDKVTLPKRQDAIYAMVASITQYVVDYPTDDNFCAAFKIFSRIGEQGQGDVMAAGAVTLGSLVVTTFTNKPMPRRVENAILESGKYWSRLYDAIMEGVKASKEPEGR